MENIDLSLVIPCYNEEKILKASIVQIFEVLDNTKISCELIFVDDCSRDFTRKIIEEIIRENPGRLISAIFHEKNTGRGRAVRDGILASCGQVAGFIDIDLEVHPRYIPSCYLAVKNGSDIAAGLRIYKFYLRSFLRYIMSRGYIGLVRMVLGMDLKDTETGFKFFNRKRIVPLLEKIDEEGWFWDTEIMARAYLSDYAITYVPCLFLRNIHKRSTVNIVRDSCDSFWKLIGFARKIRRGKRGRDIENYWHKTPEHFFAQYFRQDGVFVRSFLKARFRCISRYLEKAEGMEAIDVGCGSGLFGKVLLERGARRLTMVDYSRESLSICDKLLSSTSRKNYALVNCDARSMPFADNKFDILVSVGLLDYVADVHKTLKELARVVKPGGRLIFTVPKSPSPFFFLRSRIGNTIRKKMLRLPPLAASASRLSLEKSIKDAGLVSVDINPFWSTMWVVRCHK